MRRTLLYQVLSSLNEREWHRIILATQSPYFTTNDQVTKLLHYLKGTMTPIDRKGVESIKFPFKLGAKRYSDVQLRLLFSETLEIVEDVLTFQEIKKNKSRFTIELLASYRQKRVQKNYKSRFNRVEGQLANDLASVDQLENEHLLEFERYQHEVEVHRGDNLNIQQLLDTADKAYIAKKLRLMCYARAHQQVVEHEYQSDLSETVLHLVRDHQLYRHPVIGAYYFAYGALTKDGEDSIETYQKLRALLIDDLVLFDPKELKGLFILAINFCILQHRRGITSFTRDIFLFYKTGIESGSLTENNTISPYTYRNVVAVGIILEELEWATNFTINYKDFVEIENRESVYSFNMARIKYHMGQYEEVREFLWNTDFEDTLLSLSAKTILLKVYYLIGEYLLLDSAIESFRGYLKRKKVAKAHALNYQKIGAYMKSLRRVSSFHKNPKSIQKLMLKLKAESPFTEKSWFEEQLNLIE